MLYAMCIWEKFNIFLLCLSMLSLQYFVTGSASCFRFGFVVNSRQLKKQPANSSELGKNWCDEMSGQCIQLHKSMPQETVCITLSWGWYDRDSGYMGYLIGAPVRREQAAMMGCEMARFANMIGKEEATISEGEVKRIVQLMHYFSYKGVKPWIKNKQLPYGLNLSKDLLTKLDQVTEGTFYCCAVVPFKKDSGNPHNAICNSDNMTHTFIDSGTFKKCPLFLYDEAHEMSYIPADQHCLSRHCFQVGMQMKVDPKNNEFTQVVWGGCLDGNFVTPLDTCPKKRGNTRCQIVGDPKLVSSRFIRPLLLRAAAHLSPVMNPEPNFGWQSTTYRGLEALEKLLYAGDYKKITWCCLDASNAPQPKHLNETAIHEYLKKIGRSVKLKDEL